MAEIILIAAIGKKTRAIGREGKLLWKIPEDLKRFKVLTLGYPIIMGRKTFDSIGKALPGRKNFVISRNPDFAHLDIEKVSSLDEALLLAEESAPEKIFVIGGGEIYKQALTRADRLMLTLVDSDEEGDTFFPPYPEFSNVVSKEDHAGFSFVELTR
ncbi:MAG: dihydrofolate reductase [Patescibacteria group bacterium]